MLNLVRTDDMAQIQRHKATQTIYLSFGHFFLDS